MNIRICRYFNFIVRILFITSCSKIPAYKDEFLPVEKRLTGNVIFDKFTFVLQGTGISTPTAKPLAV